MNHNEICYTYLTSQPNRHQSHLVIDGWKLRDDLAESCKEIVQNFSHIQGPSLQSNGAKVSIQAAIMPKPQIFNAQRLFLGKCLKSY